jgi:hypothetical protein
LLPRISKRAAFEKSRRIKLGEEIGRSAAKVPLGMDTPIVVAKGREALRKGGMDKNKRQKSRNALAQPTLRPTARFVLSRKKRQKEVSPPGFEPGTL